MASLASKVAVVSGAARGIGEGIAKRLAADGARVFSLDTGQPEAPREGITDIPADVTDPAAVADAFAQIDRLVGPVDILVSNAGIQRVGLIGQVAFADFAAVLASHLHGLFLCASEAVPRMRENGGGSIVSIASAAAFVGMPGRGAYCAAKAGILGLTRALALEGAGAGIRANAVAPGFTRTGLVEQGLRDGSLQTDWMLARVPMRRLGEVDEIAEGVRFLAGPESAYMTGQTLVLDGGWTVQGVGDAPGWLGGGAPAASTR